MEVEDVAAIEDGLGFSEDLSACEKNGNVLQGSRVPLLGGSVVDLKLNASVFR